MKPLTIAGVVLIGSAWLEAWCRRWLGLERAGSSKRVVINGSRLWTSKS